MISVIVTALNEEANLRQSALNVLGAAREANVALELILVDDGSTDGTPSVVRQLASEYPEVRAIFHTENQGIGASILEAARLARFEKVAFFPGDNLVMPYTMKELFLNANSADFVAGYIVNSEGRTWPRYVLSTLFSLIYTTTFKVHLKLMNCAPVYSKSWLERVDVKSGRYSFFAELHIKLLRSGVTFVEVPCYIFTGSTKSSALKLKNVLEVIRTYLRLIVEIYVIEPQRYGKPAVRVLPIQADLAKDLGSRDQSQLIRHPRLGSISPSS